MNERLLRERIRSLLMESTRGGMDAQVSVALWILQNNHGDHATVAPAGSTVPDVTIDGTTRLEVKSSAGGANVSPFDLTVENKPDDPKAEDFQRVIDAIIDKAIDLGNITQVDVDRWDLNKNGVIEFSEYVAAVGGKYTPPTPEWAPPRSFEYTVIDDPDPAIDPKTKEADTTVALRGTDGNVYKLGAYKGVIDALKNDDIVKLSQEIDPSSGGNKTNTFIMDISSMGEERVNKKKKEIIPGSWWDDEGKQIGVWLELPDGTLRKQSTLIKSGNSVVSKSHWRAAAGSKLKATKQYEKFGEETFASQVSNNEQVIVSNEVMKEAVALWAHHLYEGGDNYIAVVSPSKIQLLGVLDDPLALGVNILSDLGAEAVESMYFGTYGTAGPNQMRAVPKLKLKTGVFTSVPRPTEADQEILDYGMVINDQGAVLKSFTKGKGTFGQKGEMEKDSGKEIASDWDEIQTSQTISANRRGDTRKNFGNVVSEVKLLRYLIRESLLLEELTKSDKKEIERIAKKQAKKEIDKVIGTSLEKTIQKEVEKTLKNKASKEEMSKISKAVIKKLYRELSFSYPQLIDRIKV